MPHVLWILEILNVESGFKVPVIMNSEEFAIGRTVRRWSTRLNADIVFTIERHATVFIKRKPYTGSLLRFVLGVWDDCSILAWDVFVLVVVVKLLEHLLTGYPLCRRVSIVPEEISTLETEGCSI